MLESFAMERERDQVPKRALGHEVLRREEPVVTFQI